MRVMDGEHSFFHDSIIIGVGIEKESTRGPHTQSNIQEGTAHHINGRSLVLNNQLGTKQPTC